MDGAIIKSKLNMHSTPGMNSESAFFYLFSMGKFSCNNEYSTKRNNFDNYLVLYTTGGLGVLEYDDNVYTLGKGNLFIIDCKSEHCYRTLEEPWEFIYMHIEGIACRGYYDIIKERFGTVGHFQNEEQFKSLWEDIFLMINANPIQNEALISLRICEILTLILDNSRYENLFGNVYKMIELRYCEKLTIDEMASCANLSKYHFIRKFKEETGMTPYEYLMIYRMNKAKALLSSSHISICETAISVGYDSQANFTRKFCEITKMTPLNFQKTSRDF